MTHRDDDHHDCCDFNVDCECVRVRHGIGDEYCGPGPTGSDGALPHFECSVRKHGEEASGDEVALEDPWEHYWARNDAGRCCAGPNETAMCADGYTVVAGDAPCVFTCCEGAVDNLTTAADVDRAGAVCWEAHANEGRRPLEWGDCCESECGLFVAGPVGRDYDDAVAYCSRIGAEIATIYSATENELAQQACGGSPPCWIGLEEVGGDAATPKESQTWRWMDGSTASYTNWYPSEPPNNEGNDERNAFIYDGMWYDAADENHIRPLCRTGDGNSPCRTVYFPEVGFREEWEERQRPGEEWFSEGQCRPKADAPAACFARPTRRADCVDDACRALKPGGAAASSKEPYFPFPFGQTRYDPESHRQNRRKNHDTYPGCP